MERYHPRVSPRHRALLDFPIDVRHRIYHEVYDRRDLFINLGPPDNPYHGRSEAFKEMHGLLLTCRKIHDEVAREVYGNNMIYIHYSDHDRLEALSRLSSVALCSLTNLTVHLHVVSCGLGRPCDYSRKPWYSRRADRCDIPLSISMIGEPCRLCEYLGRECDKPTRAQALLTAWHSIWRERILPALQTPANLHLKLVCDVADLETGRLAVQPLLELPQPRLFNCTIRLSHRCDTGLKALAQDAVVRSVVGPLPASSHTTSSGGERTPFRFTDLPWELRQHILIYTDLVAPYDEVEWNLQHGYYCRDRSYFTDENNNRRDSLHGRYFGDDGDDDEKYVYSETEEYERAQPVPLRIACWERSYPHGCFCQARHAAYSSSIHCDCWAPPKDLFLVSRSFRDDALSVFYGHNRFVIVPPGGKVWEVVTSPPERFPPSIYLRKIVPRDALRHLRQLEFVFPPFGDDQPCDYCPPNSPQLLEWQQTIRQVKPHLNLAKLTICVYFTEWSATSWNHNHYREHMSNEQIRAVFLNYVRTVKPLTLLHEMESYFVHFSWPKESPAQREGYDAWKKHKDESLSSWESIVERLIMKDESYDAVAVGKRERTDSWWLYEHMRRSYW